MSLMGCGSPPPVPLLTHDLAIYNAAGTVIATGRIDLPAQLPPNGFEGSWQLKSATASFPSGATKSGRYSCQLAGQELSIDLNPGMADNNVSLLGTPSNGSWNGTWYYGTQAGGKEMGKVTASRPDSR
jgi:hypothetical protein